MAVMIFGQRIKSPSHNSLFKQHYFSKNRNRTTKQVWKFWNIAVSVDDFKFPSSCQGRTSAPPVREVDAFRGDALGRADMREQQRVQTMSAGQRQKMLHYLNRKRISEVSDGGPIKGFNLKLQSAGANPLKLVFPEVPTNRYLGRPNVFNGLLRGTTSEVFLEDLRVCKSKGRPILKDWKCEVFLKTCEVTAKMWVGPG